MCVYLVGITISREIVYLWEAHVTVLREYMKTSEQGLADTNSSVNTDTDNATY